MQLFVVLLSVVLASGQRLSDLQRVSERLHQPAHVPYKAMPVLQGLADSIKSPLFYKSLYEAYEIPDISGFLGNLTQECEIDVGELALAVSDIMQNKTTDFNMTLIQMIDASAGIPSGILRGAFTFFGSKMECDIIRHVIPNRKRPFETGFSRSYFNMMMKDNSEPGACNGSTFFAFDLCLPLPCTRDDIAKTVAFALKTANITVNPLCDVQTIESISQPYDYRSWIVGIILAVFIVLILFAGLVDYYAVADRKSTNLAIRLLLAFSIYSNTVEIFTAAKHKPGMITPIACMRIFSMIWVIVGHTILFFMMYATNPLDFMELMEYPITMIIANAYFSVDTFLFMGGVMLSYMWFKALERNKTLHVSLYGWIMYYVHRFIRLSPPYYMMIAIYTFLYHPWNHHNPPQFKDALPESCEQYFWRNFLYINNLYDFDCMGHTWYLALDMQIYVLSPLMLIPMAISPVLGLLVTAVLYGMSIAGNIVSIYENNYPATVIFNGDISGISVNYIKYVYEAAWIRCTVYMQGILVGYFLRRYKRIRINPVLNLICWILSLAIMAFVIFCLFDYANGHDLPLFWRAMYSAFSKPLWALGLSWIVISCFYGSGGIINKFMSWNIWTPLGRLSYCIYLVHMPIILYTFSQLWKGVYFTNIWAALFGYVMPVVGISFFVGYFFSVAFELPCSKVEAILLNPHRPHAVDDKVEKVPETATTAKLDDIDQGWKIEEPQTSAPVIVANGNTPRHRLNNSQLLRF